MPGDAFDDRERELLAEVEQAESTADPVARARALNRLAVHRGSSGRDREALEDLEQALAACDDAEPDDATLRVKASVLSNRGQLLAVRSRFDAARASLSQSLSIRRQLGDVRGQVVVLGHLGYVAQSLGRYGEALERYDAALERMRHAVAAGEPRERIPEISQAAILNNLAALLHDVGDTSRAVTGYRAAYDRFEAAGDATRAVAALVNEATLLEELGDTDTARKRYERAAEQAAERGNRIGGGSALANLGLLLVKEGADDAEDVLQRAQRILADAGDQLGVARVIRHVAHARRAGGRLDEAERLLRDALDLQVGADDRDGQRSTLVELAGVAHARGRRHDAYGLYERAIDIVESTRGELVRDRHRSLRQSYFGQSLSAYDDYCLALLQDAASPAADAEQLRERAFALAERRRARELAALIARAGASRDSPAATDAATVARALLDERTALLAYVVAPSRGACLCLTAQRLEAWPIAVSGARLDEWVAGLRAWAESGAGWPAAYADELAAVLLAMPLRWLGEHAPEVERLLVVPDGPLGVAPFACLPLPDGERMLVDAFEVELIPSVGIAVELASRRRRRRPAAGLLGFGDPVLETETSTQGSELALAVARRGSPLEPLRHARRELEEVAALLDARGVEPVELLLGAKSTKSAARAALQRDSGRWRFVHLATHGVVDLDVPELSGLLFSSEAADTDAFWRAPEIAASTIDADLVVASACDTAHGRSVAGEGVLGLARSFLVAGASAVCASLWKVPDRSTATLMRALYASLLDGAEPAGALRAAQLHVREHGEPHPLHWAGFAVFG